MSEIREIPMGLPNKRTTTNMVHVNDDLLTESYTSWA